MVNGFESGISAQEDGPEQPDIHFVHLSQTRKPVIEYSGMLVIGVDPQQFPELSELPDDSDNEPQL